MIIQARAKINLFLNIIGLRSDGYHNLESLFVPLNLADVITIEKADFINVSFDKTIISNNTASKAVEALKPYLLSNQGAKISIQKKIPLGGGLGGSATDAGALLIALNKFWNLKLNLKILKQLAFSIGADVSYFLNPVPAIVKGLGEIIQPIGKIGEELHLLIIYPGFETNTQQVYKYSINEFSKPLNYDEETIKKNVYFGKNDLQFAALKISPLLVELIQSISKLEGCKVARMSGSGSSCFGIFKNKYLAFKAQEDYAKKYFTLYEHIII